MEIEEVSFKVSVPIQIRFNDIDSLGHINNNIYFSYFDLGKINYLDRLKAANVNWTEGAIVIASIKVDFFSPVFYKESIVVETKVCELGNKSGVFLQQIRNIKTNEIKCRCRSIFVTYSAEHQTSMPVPDVWRSAISDFEEIDF